MRATAVLLAGDWDAGREVDRLVADHDDRHRRRLLMTTEQGARLMLDLRETTRLRDGDGLLVEGTDDVVRVVAASEALLAVTAPGAPGVLLRLAWHLGNRHLPAMLGADRLLIRDDHVIADMLRGLGAMVTAVVEPFDPEGGAYAGQALHYDAHRHDHAHVHGHDHGHG